MSNHFESPQTIEKAYEQGLVGSYCDKEELDALLGELKHPLFSVAAHNLYGTGEGKISLPFKSLLKYDPGFGPAEAQKTGDCYAKGTIVIGEETKTIEKVKIGDMIFGPDGDLTRVISTKKQISQKSLVKIKTKESVPLIVTEDHEVMVSRDGNRSLIEAKHIEKGDYLVTPASLLDGEKFNLSPFSSHKDFDWFLGYFLGDGWCDTKQIEITFAEHQEDYYRTCKDLLEDFGFRVRRCNYKGKDTTAFRFRCWCPGLAEPLRAIAYNQDKDKVFPLGAIGNTEILCGLIDSDGFRKPGKETFDSKSVSLAYGVYYSYLKLGYRPTINIFHRSKNGSYETSSVSYRVSCIFEKKKNYSYVEDGLLHILVSSTELEAGSHEVYDIGVEHEDHCFLANGVISHNCVSHATRNAVDISRAVEIDNGEAEDFVGRSATEGIYGARGHRGQGMSCSAAARFVSTSGGILVRKKYSFADLSKYNVNVGMGWGGRGVPRDVLTEASKHQVKTVSMVHTVEAARDALANGYAISVCSSQGFGSSRDKSGIASPKGSWAHAMAWIGCDDSREIFNETLFLVQNSWGIWNSGPLRLGQPEGSFWIRESVAKRMLGADGSFVFSNIDGFKPRKLDYSIITEVL